MMEKALAWVLPAAALLWGAAAMMSLATTWRLRKTLQELRTASDEAEEALAKASQRVLGIALTYDTSIPMLARRLEHQEKETRDALVEFELRLLALEEPRGQREAQP